MKSTELSTALEIIARQGFRRILMERMPWLARKRKDRSRAFHHCWQIAVGQAAYELQVSDQEEWVKELQRSVPTALRSNWGLGPTGQSDWGQAS